MTAKIAGVAALLFAVFPWSTPSSARAQAPVGDVQTYSAYSPGGYSVEQQAPGQPIIDCRGMPAISAQLKAGLPVQDEWIRRTEEQLKTAREGVQQSKEALQGLALKTAKDLVVHQLKMVRELQDAIKNARGNSSIARQWLTRVDKLTEGADAIEKLANSGTAGAALGTAISKNRGTLEEFIRQLNESGISDELGIKAAEFAGPVGVVVVETFVAARDASFALWEGKMNADQADLARENLEQMQAATAKIKSRIYELDGFLAEGGECGPRAPEPKDRILVQAGASCGQAIDRIARETAALKRDGEKLGIEFAGADAVGTAAAGLKPILESSANKTLALAGKVQNYQKTFDTWDATCENYRVTFDNIVACGGTPDCLIDLAKRQNKAIAAWLLSLDEGAQAAVERAQKASSLLNNYMSRVADTAIGGAPSVVDELRSCTQKYQADAATQANAVDARDPKPTVPQPNPTPAVKSGGGLSRSTILTGALVGGAIAAGAAAKAAANKSGTQSKSGDCAEIYAFAKRCPSGGISSFPSPVRCGIPPETYFGGTINNINGEAYQSLICR